MLIQFLVGGLRARVRALEDHVPCRQNRAVLDMGRGLGYVARQFSGGRYVGVDLDAHQPLIARFLLRRDRGSSSAP